jgi:UPF0755 protein
MTIGGTTGPPKTNRRRWLLIAVAGVVALLAVIAGDVGLFLFRPFAPPRRDVVIEVAEGTSLTSVAWKLAGTGLVTRPRYFILIGRFLSEDRTIQIGEYALRTDMRPLEILNRLISGAVIQTAVTIPEGWTLRDIATQLDDQQLMPAEAFLAAATDRQLIAQLNIEGKTLEGYLFPSTYYVTKQTTPEHLVRRMVGQLNATLESIGWRPADPGRPPGPNSSTLRDVVTLASIIEKETARDDERPLVSAVFHNRLNKRMPLQSDPTVIYALANFDGNLHRSDLSVDSPYNTYHVKGLPPGPIANPGRASLEAALHPAPVNYLYFVSKNDGRHIFSATLAEHQKAVARYQPPVKKKRRAKVTSAG